MTSIEWLREELWQQFKWQFSDNIFEQAKEMHKQEIIDAYETSHISMMTSDQYYDETFVSKTEEQVREVGMMKQKLEQLILLLESRSQQLENEATSKTDIEGLTTEQTRDVKIKKIGESQGINLCVLAIKKIIT